MENIYLDSPLVRYSNNERFSRDSTDFHQKLLKEMGLCRLVKQFLFGIEDF